MAVKSSKTGQAHSALYATSYCLLGCLKCPIPLDSPTAPICICTKFGSPNKSYFNAKNQKPPLALQDLMIPSFFYLKSLCYSIKIFSYHDVKMHVYRSLKSVKPCFNKINLLLLFGLITITCVHTTHIPSHYLNFRPSHWQWYTTKQFIFQ